MKKFLFFSVLVCFAGFNLFAANPIPSYNVLVSGRASFQEQKAIGGINPAKERRQMNIQSSTANPNTGAGKSFSIVTILVYRLDGSILQGPFYIYCGQSLQVNIDNSLWGVDITTSAAKVSVWTSDQAN